MKKLVLKKYKVTQLNNLKSINGGENGDNNGNETIGTVDKKKNDLTVMKIPTRL